MDVSQAKIGNVAPLLMIESQTVNLGDGPAWLQQVDLDKLRDARGRLLATSRHHETRAWIPPVLVVNVYGLTLWLLIQFGASMHALTPTDRVVFAILALPIAFLVWFTSWDVRRRDRLIARVAERRLAEVVVEIAVRSPAPDRTAYGRALYRRLKSLMRRTV